MRHTIKSAEEFIKKKEEQFKSDKRNNKNISMKDIGRKGELIFKRESCKFIKQNSIKEKVFIIEKFVKSNSKGKLTHNHKKGDIEYRIGYYIVGKNGTKKGKWTWGQFCPLIPKKDLTKIIKELQKL
jgi:hypothetical protein